MLRNVCYQEQWIALRVDQQKYPRGEAISQWENAVKMTPKESTDQMGPQHSRLRVPMPTEEYVDLANTVEHGKDLVMESKKRKIGNPEDVAQAQSMLSAGHASFGNPMFDDVGGKLAAVASASNNVFSSAVTGQDNIFRQQLEAAKIKKEEEKNTTPTKIFDPEITAGRLLEKVSDAKASLFSFHTSSSLTTCCSLCFVDRSPLSVSYSHQLFAASVMPTISLSPKVLFAP